MNRVLDYIIKISAALSIVVVSLLLFPRHTSNFKYYFEIGKPWGYSLLTAEQDYPIYKTDDQLLLEQEQVLRDFAPYYNINNEIARQQVDLLMQSDGVKKLNNRTSDFLLRQVKRAYQLGIIDPQEQENLNNDKIKKITLISDKHVSKTARVNVLYTPRSAYTMIMNNATRSQQNQLKRLQLETYIVPNLAYDSTTTEIVKESLIADISLTQGVIQKGEKIIDKGEVVDDRTYQILTSIQRTMDEKEKDRRSEMVSLAANVLLLCMLVGMLILYLAIFRRHIISDNKSLWLIASTMLLTIIIASLTLRYTRLSIYIVPIVWTTILIRLFLDSRTAFFAHLITTLILALYVNSPLEFIIVQTTVGLVAVSSLRDITERSQLASTVAYVLLAYILSYTIFTLFSAGDYKLLQIPVYVCIAVNALLLICSYGLIYILERVFRLVSSITLVELTNVNNDLLREFAERAPGSFQHSMQVSTLAFEAAKHIGANALLVRAGALYHDIGKMNNPHLFTENQTDNVNPLNQLTPQEAAQKIIAHVSDGLTIAKKQKLPAIIQNFIATHHGTSKVKYFYNTYLNEHPGEEIDASLFTYPGPMPNSKETAILMMADAVEARSRSLAEYTEESIEQMVEQMVGAQIADGQFSLTPLSFADVEEIKKVFVARIVSINHHRIAYPEVNK